ncbi:hypothetical protein [Enterococcus sp. DIV1420a]|uniref:hypothetical protein n=1 Tax=Enterococcus sp. DIV1420a TaxID=2774672 RepID=UPI003F1FFED5
MNKRKKLLVVTLLIVFILLVIGSYFLLNKHEQPTQTKLKEDPQAVTYNNKIEKPKDYDATQLVFPGYDDIKVPEGTDKAYVSLVNPVFNQASFKFTISNEADNQMLLETGLIKPGKAVNEIPIPKGLIPGTYPLKMGIQVFDLTTEKQLNGASTTIQLIVVEKQEE